MVAAEQSVTVEHQKGLHARPATVFVQIASEFDCEVEVTKAGSDEIVDAKSSLGVMSLGVEPGEEITVSADGSDSEAAVSRLIELVEHDFKRSNQ